MSDGHALSHPGFEILDRCVVLAALGGVVFNGWFDTSLAGVVLTLVAAITYGLARNRIANLDDFESATAIRVPPGIDLVRFTQICKWLGSRALFDGLLGDLVDPDIGATPEAARRYLRTTLWPAIRIRIKEKILTLLWLDHSL